MTKYLNILFLITLFNSTSSFSQNNFDCVTALEVCTKDKLVLDFSIPPFGSIVENLDNWCETNVIPQSFLDNTIWLKLKFKTSGDFDFVITPSNGDDIDFVMLKSVQDECGLLQAERCMFSGQSVGQPSTSCLGPTGLSVNSSDFFEDAGCFPGDDNFLAPIIASAGETYFIAIANFSISNNNAVIEFGGLAALDCESSASNENIDNRIKINSDSGGLFYIQNLPSSYRDYKIQLHSITGELVFQNLIHHDQILDLNDIKNGLFVLRILHNNRVIHISKVIITN